MSVLPATTQDGSVAKVNWRSQKLPRLYAIATKPTTPNQPLTAEWSLYLCILPTRTVDSEHISQDEQPASTISSSPPSVASSETEEEQHYYFSRFHPTSFSQEVPADIIAKISLSSVPSGAESPVESIELVHQIVAALETVYMTPDSASWLRQALFALQRSEILPAITSGFAVNQFMLFATAYLEQQVQDQTAESSEVKYSKVLREREGLRRATVNYESAPRSIPAARYESNDDLDNDEYEWSLPYRGKQARDGQTWNGFRSTGSSNASSRSSSRARGISESWRNRDVHGGVLPAQVA